MAEQWTLKGTVLGACNCDNGCPCNFNGRPTYGFCEGGYTWCVESGDYGGTRLDGLYLTFYAEWPGAIHEGGGKAASWIDERADDEQREAMRTLLSGQVGGPWGIFINTYEFVGEPASARYDVDLAGERSRVRIGDDAVVLETAPITNPVTGAEVHPKILLPEGFVTKEIDPLVSTTFRVNDGVSYDHSGKYVLLGPFEYAGP